MSATLRTVSAAIVCLLGLGAGATAQVFNCGDTIGPKAKVALTADIELCARATSDPGLTIEGPATVDMNGHSLRCDPNDPPGEGILIIGKGVKLLRGSVHECTTGLRVAGEGKHKIEDFVAEDNVDDGIRASSDKNSFKRIAANDNDEDGIELDGDGNKVEDAAAINNGGEGFEIDGDKAQLKRITAVNNDNEGLHIDDGSKAKVKEGVFIDNGDDGVELEGGDSKVEKSVALRNGDDEDAGFDSRDGPNKIKQCRAFAHPHVGIRTNAQGDKIQKNTALGNDTDLVDQNAACDGNTWSKNVFGTSEADGVPSPACIE